MKFKGWQRSLALTLAAILVLATAIFVGTLAISTGLHEGAAQTAMAAPACARMHVVRRGETLSNIAQRYGLTVSELARANHLRNYDFIYAGQTLCLPTAGGGGTKLPGAICVEGRKVDVQHRGLGGFIINAQMEGSDRVLQAVTDDNGYFRFDNLEPGLWTFSEVLTRGWEPVTPSEFQKELEYGHDGCYQIRFKNKQVPIPACLIVAKVNEADGSPLAGWEIQIKPKFGGSWQSGVTDKGGQVRFDDLKPGKWLVRETVLYPWEPVDPATGETEIELHPMANEEDCGRVVFKNRRKLTGCVVGRKVDDQHQGLEGWTIYARPTGATDPTFSATTDADGNFRFDDLVLGEWTLWEDVEPGWTPVTASKFEVTVDSVEECKEVRFKNRPPDLCAQGYKLDENGFGLGGWTIRAYPKGHPDKALETVTEPNGHYRFCGLTLGPWIFEEVRPVGWKALTPEQVEVNVTYPGPGKDVEAPIFRNAPPRGCIEGRKVDEFEVGLPKWNISIQRADGTGPVWHRWTDGTGYFKICDLPMGDYVVWEEPQVGWKPISPPKVTVTLEPSDEDMTVAVVFVNKQVPRDICIDGYKKDATDGAGLPGWEIKLQDLAGNVLATTTTDGTGYYRFGKLEPGTYIVSETLQDGWWPVSATTRRVTVSWPPKHTCTQVDFWNRQKTAPPPPPPCGRWHVVRRCETLSSIALRYGVPMSKLMAANGLTNPDFIWVGQKLCIPDP